jgi:hypothetical protein
MPGNHDHRPAHQPSLVTLAQAAIHVVDVARRRIPPIYLLDTLAELALAAW